MGFDFLTGNMWFNKNNIMCLPVGLVTSSLCLKDSGFCQGQSLWVCLKRNTRNFSFLELASHGLLCSMGSITSCASMNHLCFCCWMVVYCQWCRQAPHSKSCRAAAEREWELNCQRTWQRFSCPLTYVLSEFPNSEPPVRYHNSLVL